jgi:hypothetical protein
MFKKLPRRVFCMLMIILGNRLVKFWVLVTGGEQKRPTSFITKIRKHLCKKFTELHFQLIDYYPIGSR